jgi:hypothetical protein
MIAERLLLRLEGVRQSGSNKWMARCPCHIDGTPSLSVTDLADRVLIHCFAGCEPANVTAAVGLALSDLFPAKLLGHAIKAIKQRLLTPIQALEIVAKEALLVCLYASELARGKELSIEDKDRLFIAAARINEAYRSAL